MLDSKTLKKASDHNKWKRGEGSEILRVPMGLVEPIKSIIKSYRFAHEGGLAKLIQDTKNNERDKAKYGYGEDGED